MIPQHIAFDGYWYVAPTAATLVSSVVDEVLPEHNSCMILFSPTFVLGALAYAVVGGRDDGVRKLRTPQRL